jgi:hypothetical protein
MISSYATNLVSRKRGRGRERHGLVAEGEALGVGWGGMRP